MGIRSRPASQPHPLDGAAFPLLPSLPLPSEAEPTERPPPARRRCSGTPASPRQRPGLPTATTPTSSHPFAYSLSSPSYCFASVVTPSSQSDPLWRAVLYLMGRGLALQELFLVSGSSKATGTTFATNSDNGDIQRVHHGLVDPLGHRLSILRCKAMRATPLSYAHPLVRRGSLAASHDCGWLRGQPSTRTRHLVPLGHGLRNSFIQSG